MSSSHCYSHSNRGQGTQSVHSSKEHCLVLMHKAPTFIAVTLQISSGPTDLAAYSVCHMSSKIVELGCVPAWSVCWHNRVTSDYCCVMCCCQGDVHRYKVSLNNCRLSLLWSKRPVPGSHICAVGVHRVLLAMLAVGGV